MVYYLYALLHDQFSWLNLLRYQTVRAMAAFLFCFAFVLFFEPRFIAWLKSMGVRGQPIRDDGPKMHATKQGTPTMGGAVMVLGLILSTLLFTELSSLFVWMVLAVLLCYGALGFFDDWSKVTRQNSKGLSGPHKLFWQAVIAVGLGLVLISAGFSTELRLPFLKNAAFDLGIFFVPFMVIVLVGSSNAVNLTDGLDGLAIGPIMTTALAYGIFCYLGGNIKSAEYLAIPYLPGLGEVSIVLAAVVGAGLGFLWYNTFPAQVFMGDMGALALGALLGCAAVLAKQEIVLVLAGGIFVVEALSVIIQRYWYKLTKKRVFRMAPIHHHFELMGLSEPKIIVRFWIISILLALLSLTTLKIR